MRTSGKVARNLEMKPGGTRILQWLARYPLQRLDDLEVALAPWQSRSTISRFLSSLLADGLIEAILPGMAQGKRLYHLSHKGALWLASSDGSEAGPHFSTEREKLIRWLPRLPAALPLQDCINELVAGAARALTRQGRRAILCVGTGSEPIRIPFSPRLANALWRFIWTARLLSACATTPAIHQRNPWRSGIICSSCAACSMTRA